MFWSYIRSSAVDVGQKESDYLALKYIRKWLLPLPSPATTVIFLPSHKENLASTTGYPRCTSECICNRATGILQCIIHNQKHFPYGQVPWHTLRWGQTAVVYLRLQETGWTFLLQVTNGGIWLFTLPLLQWRTENRSYWALSRQKSSRRRARCPCVLLSLNLSFSI